MMKENDADHEAIVDYQDDADAVDDDDDGDDDDDDDGDDDDDDDQCVQQMCAVDGQCQAIHKLETKTIASLTRSS